MSTFGSLWCECPEDTGHMDVAFSRMEGLMRVSCLNCGMEAELPMPDEYIVLIEERWRRERQRVRNGSEGGD